MAVPPEPLKTNEVETTPRASLRQMIDSLAAGIAILDEAVSAGRGVDPAEFHKLNDEAKALAAAA